MKGIFKRTIAAALGVLCAVPFAAMSQPDSQPVTVHAASVRTDSSGRKMEYLDRGVYAVNAGNAVFVSWRSLEEDPAGCAFNLYRTTDGTTTKLNASPITGGTNYTDTTADQTKDNTYFVKMVTGGAETATDGSFTLKAGGSIFTKGNAGAAQVIPIKEGGTIHFVWVATLTGTVLMIIWWIAVQMITRSWKHTPATAPISGQWIWA